ncbi:MAG: DUF2254 domain-containing protein [Alphaproteobacteria bacterium]|jgi:uncharacterized membrane protein|nr:DUF2254 domain-containing protein [Alphaproteobacteria bacterium]MBU2041230.1 DUF2254 domain-containing protein [Alphaproteobacteria bacterium]MBU2124941.1 DUF2254 domain-containing protein [Alphaproteobacteria bacterium]MBU2208090.1 DUF2254 domain-containing protein [Alphaproteobacteria bacterium]MBU2291640.1 DUF2254 domain-containing protein [Alphaproteobacteria bacterium]
MNRWRFYWLRLTRELWVRATAYAALGVGAALLASIGEGVVPKDMAERLGGESVEEILTILASSLLAVATFSVGAMVTAYTAVSQGATPRVAALVTSDGQTQKSLATFVGAFLYSIVSVTAINASYYGAGGRAILFLVSLGVVALVAYRLLAWINRLSSLARVGHMIDLVEERACEALEARRRRPLSGRNGLLKEGLLIPSRTTGYIQNVDPELLQKCAADSDCRVQILAPPGAFVRRGEPLARISLNDCEKKAVADFHSAFAVGGSRSFDQDPRFGLIVLGEIAAKALSPGVNDPGTAIQVIGSGVRLLDMWLYPETEEAEDPSACDRVLAAPLDESDLMDDIFGPIARYGAGDVPVTMRLLKALRTFSAVPGPFREPARRMARDLLARARVSMPIAADVSRVRAIGD